MMLDSLLDAAIAVSLFGGHFMEIFSRLVQRNSKEDKFKCLRSFTVTLR
jgi:hypothetical protein